MAHNSEMSAAENDTRRDRHGWLGREDSNLGIAVDMLDNARALPTCSHRSSQACCDATTKVPDLMENSVPARPVDVQRGKTHIGTCDEDRRTQHRILIRILLPPSEELRNAIDLIIVTTVWK